MELALSWYGIYNRQDLGRGTWTLFISPLHCCEGNVIVTKNCPEVASKKGQSQYTEQSIGSRQRSEDCTILKLYKCEMHDISILELINDASCPVERNKVNAKTIEGTASVPPVKSGSSQCSFSGKPSDTMLIHQSKWYLE